MEGFLSSIAHLSLKLLLLRKLRDVVYAWTSLQRSQQFSSENLQVALSKVATTSEVAISLRRSKDFAPILYTSAIALRLAAQYQKPAADIGDQLSLLLLNSSDSTSSHHQFSSSIVWQYFTIQTASGWICCKLTPRGTAAWLQQLVTLAASGSVPRSQILSVTHSLQMAQYTHARCCTLLRLGQQEGLIPAASSPVTVNQANSSENRLQLPITFELAASQFLKLHHSTEQQLISHLLTVSDWCCDRQGAATPQEYLTWANGVSQTFMPFYRDCRIWGEVRQTDPELVQARLGLVWATQAILRALLQEGAGMIAPTVL